MHLGRRVIFFSFGFSDDFMAQQMMGRSASEAALPYTTGLPPLPPLDKPLNLPHHGDYYNSPPSEDSYGGSYEENSSFLTQSISEESRESRDPLRQPIPGRFPEYKH